MKREVIDQSGNHRLTVTYKPVEGGGANFESMVWAVKDGEIWTNNIVITREQFQSENRYRRWVAELHSFCPATGTAIIKVAEGDAVEKAPGGVRYHYSWREWDLQNNREINLFGICKDPFEKYETSD